ncbi:uncharacterized protein C21orf58 [Etheostoma cragini]|uniref:uncharacterized protein C21orf58 n=1 Tax=Etheostoma cragini TaxID=417921 RepID=UPI00155E147F|nr:uncharacterized protein C21orf58 [Etheostoma cragini]
MTRLKLKLLEKRLENQKHIMDNRAESAQSARSYDGELDQLHRALRRKQDLLQRLREQHMLEDLNRPHTWGGSQRQYKSHFFTAPQPPPPPPLHQPAPALSFLPHPPPVPPQPSRIIQQTLPQQPATLIQQLVPQLPLIPPPPPYPAPRSGSIKEDMVELMLMQNAQMHQIIMHNMMLKAMPPMLPAGGPSHCVPQTTYLGQESYQGNPILLRPDVKPRGRAVHHHHHYCPTLAATQLPPISQPTWLPGVSSDPAGAHLPSIHHATDPFTLPPLNV